MALWVLYCRDASGVKYVVFRVPEIHKDSELEYSTTALQLWSRLTADMDVDSKRCIAMCIALVVFLFCQN